MPLDKIENVKEIASRMMRDFQNEIDLVRMIDKAYNIEYNLDPDIKKLRWVREVPPTDPFDSVNGAKRILSGNRPVVQLDPYTSDKLTRERMNSVEKWLEWQLTGSPDEPSVLAADIVESALLYDQVSVETIFLPRQNKRNKTNSKRIEAMREEQLTHGQFSFSVYHPEAAYMRMNGNMLEAVLVREVMTPDELKMKWGDAANKLNISASEEKMGYVTVFDYMDWDGRYIWGIPTGDRTVPGLADAAGGLMILKEKRNEDFLPWTSAIGGGHVTRDGFIRRKPLLYSIVISGQDLDKFVIDSLAFSTSAATAAGPQIAVENSQGETRIAYWNPFRVLELKPGEKIVNIELSKVDPALQFWSQEMAMRMEKSGLSSILRGGVPPGGVAFQSLNLASQSALKSLGPYKKLSERALASVCSKILKWMKMTNTEMKIPGENLTILAKDIPDNPYIRVILTEDAPIDHMAQITAAINAVRDLGYSKTRALETINERPDEVFKEKAFEQFAEVEMANAMQARTARAQMMAQMENQGLGILANMSQDPAMMEALEQLQAAIVQQAEQAELAKSNPEAAAAQAAQAGEGQGAIGPGAAAGLGDDLAGLNPAAGETPPSAALGPTGEAEFVNPGEG